MNFFGNPQLLINGKNIEVNSEKAKSVLFYLLYNEKVTRDELLNIFWQDFPEENARSNLRNVLSRLRTALGIELFITPNNKELVLNSDFTFSKDLDLITDYRNTQILDIKSFTFLESLNPLNADEFYFFKESVQAAYNEIIIDNLESQRERYDFFKDENQVKDISELIIKIDPYNEGAYHSIIKYYVNQGDYNKALSHYKKLENVLKSELNIEPNEEIHNLIESISKLNEYKNKLSGEKTIFRHELLSEIIIEFQHYTEGRMFNHIVLGGDLGVGKSTLIYRFYQKQKNCCTIVFYDFSLDTLDCIEQSLMQNNYDDSKKKIYILYNIQELEIDTLILVLSKLEQNNCFIILEYNNTLAVQLSTINYLKSRRKIKYIDVTGLNYTEFSQVITEWNENKLDAYRIINDKEWIFQRTQGNFLLIDSFLENICTQGESTVKNIIEKSVARLMYMLNNTEKYVLGIISCSHGGIDLDYFTENCGINLKDLASIINALSIRGLISSNENALSVNISLKYPALQDVLIESIYAGGTSKIRKEILNYYNSKTNIIPTITSYDKFIQIAKINGDELNYIKHSISKLKYILGYVDEFYPNLRYYSNVVDLENVNKKDIYKKIKDINKRLNNLKTQENPNLLNLYAEINYIYGRSLIRDGYNKEGQFRIDKAILLIQDYNKEKELGILYARCLLEKAYLGLRIEDSKLLESYLFKINKLIKENNFSDIKPIVKRLEGYLNFIIKDYQNSISCYLDSIKSYELSWDSYNEIYGICSNHNYMAMCYSEMKNYDKAYEQHNLAIEKCKNRGLEKPLDEFYKEYAYTAYRNGDNSLAYELCEFSKNYYNKFGTNWERSVVDNIFSLMCLEIGDIEQALKHHAIAAAYSNKSPTRKELMLHSIVEQGIQESKQKEQNENY